MERKNSENPKSYKNSAILFLIAGLFFIGVDVVGSKIGVFLPLGITMVILSIVYWQRTKNLT